MTTEEDKARFFAAKNLLPEAIDVSTNGTQDGASQALKKKPDLDAVYMFVLKIAQDRGITFYQTSSFAIVLYYTMPTELVNITKFNRNKSETEILFDKRPPQVTEVTRIKKTQCSRMLNQLREPRCTHMWNQHGRTRCAITVNKLKALSYQLPTSRRSRTVARQRDQEKTSEDTVVGETGLRVS